MNNAIFNFSKPDNERIYDYAPGSNERKLLTAELDRMSGEELDIPLIIGGREVRTGKKAKIVMPHDHQHVLGYYHLAGEQEVKMAIDAAMKAHKEWESFPWVERASVILKIADLIAYRYRHWMNASTMLGQSKNVFQAEIDSACETIDFLRFNAWFASGIYSDQPASSTMVINRMEYRPLEGFVFAVTPFNFTAIASNLNMSPVLMGNTTVWKPSSTSILSNYVLMQIYEEAGLPDGVVNFLPGRGSLIGKVVLGHGDMNGIHFTGSTDTFNNLWKMVAENMAIYRSYPKIIGETGGKDFVFVHPSADPQEVAVAIVRGSFEYQGQKCSAASRAYLPVSLWPDVKKRIGDMLSEIKMGDVRDLSNFVNAVIDEPSFDNIMGYIDYAKKSSDAEIVFGGKGDKSKGYFIEPTVILTTDPKFKSMVEEIFGPVITFFVYDDNKYEETLKVCDQTSNYALTGSIFSRERAALLKASEILRYASGNIYYNDKPTGAVVGQQPFGGARASGTNDKSGSYLNLLRWTNPRTIKENLVPPRDYKYPFLLEG